jgi:EDD domain protein, DegV family
MREYVIATDSTCDLSAKMAKELQVKVVPLSFIMGGETYVNSLDYKSMDIKVFYDKLRKGEMSTTTQVNSEEFAEFFEPLLKEGKDVLYVAFSSGLSGTCQGAMIAQKELSEKYPDRKLLVVDSKAASMGEGLLVYLAAQRKKDGEDIETVYQWLEDTKLKMAHWFTVDDLNHLKRGGRVSTATALVGTMLGIKPMLHVDDEGHLIPKLKVRGRKQSLDMLVRKVEETIVSPKDQIIFISHGDCADDANYVAKEVKKSLGVKAVVINHVGPVIGAHSGPGTVAIFFIAENRG